MDRQRKPRSQTRGSDLMETRNLLAEAVATLERLTSSQPDLAPVSSRTFSQPQPPVSSHLVSNSARPTQDGRTHARSERLNLFRSRTVNWNSSRRPSSSRNKRKISTWQHDFICLAKTHTTSPPSPLEKGILLQAGLGLQRLSLTDCNDSELFHSELLEAFPKLHDAGG
jgi:hypothetical protein